MNQLFVPSFKLLQPLHLHALSVVRITLLLFSDKDAFSTKSSTAIIFNRVMFIIKSALSNSVVSFFHFIFFLRTRQNQITCTSNNTITDDLKNWETVLIITTLGSVARQRSIFGTLLLLLQFTNKMMLSFLVTLKQQR